MNRDTGFRAPRTPGALGLLTTAALRFHLARRVEFALCLLGVALGVAVMVAMDLAIDSARSSFALATEALFGRTTHVVEGGAAGIDGAVYRTLRTRARHITSAPVVQGQLGTRGEVRRELTLLGVDPFAEADFRAHLPAPGDDPAGVLSGLLTRPGAVLATRETLDALGWSVGQRVELLAGERLVEIEVLATLEPRDRLTRLGLANVLVCDVASAQEILGTLGRLSRIDLVLEADGEAASLAALEALLPPDTRIEPAAARTAAATELTRAFYFNLRMLSLLALVVGLFIIYNAMTFAVVRRRRIIGRVRAIGATRGEILIATAVEGLALAGLGCLLGAVLGVALAEELLALVARTVDDLYHPLASRQLLVDAAIVARGVAAGLAGALVASTVPALEAARVAPRAAMVDSSLERRSERRAPRLAAGAAALLLACPVLVASSGDNLAAGFAVLLALVAAGVLLAPATVRALTWLVSGALTRRADPRLAMAVRGLGAGLSRTGVAVAALAVALAASIAMAIMVASFRGSLEDWLSVTLEADLYVGLAGSAPSERLDDALVERVAVLPGVRGVSRSTDREVASAHGRLWLKAVNVDGPRYRDLAVIAGRSDAWRAIAEPGAAAVSEPLASRAGLAPGAVLELDTDRGPRQVRIAAVFRDYGSQRGLVLVSRSSYRSLFDDAGYTGIGVHLAPDADAESLLRALESEVASVPAARVRSNRWLREASLAIFDRTFLITRVMQWLATAVACVGVVSALMALALERARELAVLRMQGMTRRELFASLQVQNAMLGLAAGVLALPLGLAMAIVLVEVVNRRAFGWGMDFLVEPRILASALALALVAALAAGAYPVWRMASTPPAQALREAP